MRNQARKITDSFKFRLKKILRYALILVAILIVIPTALIFLYASPAINPPSTLMLARWASFQYVSRQWVDLKDINPVLVHSVMMAEDAKFCAHNGVDWNALNGVIDDAIEGEKNPRCQHAIYAGGKKPLFVARAFIYSQSA